MARTDTIKMVDGNVYYLGTAAGVPCWKAWEVGTTRLMGIGSVELRRTKRAGLHVVRFSARGNYLWSYALRGDGYRLLTANGGVAPKPSAVEDDPFRAILRRMGAPSGALVHHAEGERASVLSHTSGVTDGRVTWDREADEEYVVGATYALATYDHKHTGGAWSTYLSALHVWPGANVEVVEEALKEGRLSYSVPLWEHDPHPMADDPEFVKRVCVHELKEAIKVAVRTEVRPITFSYNNFAGQEGLWAALWLLIGLSLEAMERGLPSPSRSIERLLGQEGPETAQAVLEALWGEICNSRVPYEPITYVGVRRQGYGIVIERAGSGSDSGESVDDTIVHADEFGLMGVVGFGFEVEKIVPAMGDIHYKNRDRLILPERMATYADDRPVLRP